MRSLTPRSPWRAFPGAYFRSTRGQRQVRPPGSLALDDENPRQRAPRIVGGRGIAVNPRVCALVPKAMPSRRPATVRAGLPGRHGVSLDDGPAPSPSLAPK